MRMDTKTVAEWLEKQEKFYRRRVEECEEEVTEWKKRHPGENVAPVAFLAVMYDAKMRMCQDVLALLRKDEEV